MKTNKKKVTPPAPAAKTDLVAGRFRPDSFKAKLFNQLKDGQPKTFSELKRSVSGCKNVQARLRIIEINGVKLKRDGKSVKFVGLGSYKAA